MSESVRRSAPPAPNATGTLPVGLAQTLGVVGIALGAALFAACSAGESGWAQGAADGGAASSKGSSGGSTGSGSTSGGGGGAGSSSGGGGVSGSGAATGDGGSDPTSAGLPTSRLIGGATLDPSSFWPPTSEDCTTTLEPFRNGADLHLHPQAYFSTECAGYRSPTGKGRSGYPYPPIVAGSSFSGFQAIVRAGIVTATAEMPFFKPTWLNDDDLRRIYAYLAQVPLVETKACQPILAPSAADISATTGIAT